MRIINTALFAGALLLLCSCYEDKGNYEYGEQPVITVENLPSSLHIVQKTGYIQFDPIVKSSQEGVVEEGNPNFEFGCKLYKTSGTFGSGSRWIDINEEKTKKVNFLADLDAESHTAWYTITDKRTGVTTNFKVDIAVSTLDGTDEGWMVLCGVGEENRARLDMVASLPGDQISTIHNIWNSTAPQLNNPVRIMFDARLGMNGGDYIWLCTKDGSYSLNNSTLQMAVSDNLKNTFLVSIGNQVPVYTESVPVTGRFAITDEGNLYYQKLAAGSTFEFPVNVLTEYKDPEFKVAPFVGVVMARTSIFSPVNKALLYDKDNKRFIGWSEGQGVNSCFALSDPEINKKFSFTTGKDLVTMINTTRNGVATYAVLQDNGGKRYMCGINIEGNYDQEYYSQIDAEGFGQADQFAIHSKYPYMFYGVGNKVYCYQLYDASLTQPLTLDDEEITLVKFNPFQNPQTELNDDSNEFWDQQYRLVVGSYKKNASDENGGILRFYEFDKDNRTLTKVAEYAGFGKIKDVVYRERRK